MYKYCMVLALVVLSLVVHTTVGIAAVTGVVTDTKGDPVAGATVTFTDESNLVNKFSDSTDAQGKYEIDISGTTGVDASTPSTFSLGQNYPNPFNPTTTIPLTLDSSGHISVAIYNIIGQRVATVIDNYVSAGSHYVTWNGMDDRGNHVSAGIYLYQLRTGRHTETKKMLLLDGGDGSLMAKLSMNSGKQSVAKNAAVATYTITITHSGIIPYKKTGVKITDGQTMDFVVSLIGGTTSFSDSFNDQTKISQTDRISVNTTNGQLTLQPEANSLTNSETLLLTHIGSDYDFTSPAIAGGGGGTPTGITYTTGNGGYNGTDEAAIINGNGHYTTFPVAGNFNYKKGTIDFWLSFSDWNLTGGHTPDDPNEETILYAVDGNKFMWLRRNWNGVIQLQFLGSGGGVYSLYVNAYGFIADSWHRFTYTWNIQEDSFYIAVWLDGVYKGELADPSPNTWDINSTFSTFNPTTFYIGNRSDGLRPLNGKIDELRITSTEYSATLYPGKAGILTSTAFDTGVSSPVWGKIKWNETLASKTDIELQTSASDDGSTWTNWFSTDKGMITITFDDGYSGVYNNAYQVMNTFGFKGVPYIVTNRVGTSGYMTVSQLQELKATGWEMGSHTSTHSTPTVSNLSTAKNWLNANGFDSNAFAYPGGVFDQNIITLVSDYHTTARTIINQYQTYNTKYRLYSYPGNSAVSNVNSWIDSVVNKKAWGILTFHSIGEPTTPENVSTADFTSILQHISNSGLDVLTMRDALTRLAMYTNNSGDQILSANKRYIRYRAILHSYNGTDTPAITSVQLSAPAKFYKNIATTIGSDGTYNHATWPQTTDIPIDNLTVTPSSGSVTVTIDTWNTTGDRNKQWTASSSVATSTDYTIGDLLPNTYYQFKLDGIASTTAITGATCTNGVCLSDSSGNLTFTYSGGYSTHIFALEKDVTSPNAFKLSSPANNY